MKYAAVSTISGTTSRKMSRKMVNIFSYSMGSLGQTSRHFFRPSWKYTWMCKKNWRKYQEILFIQRPRCHTEKVAMKTVRFLTITRRNELWEDGNRWHQEQARAPDDANQLVGVLQGLPPSWSKWLANGEISWIFKTKLESRVFFLDRFKKVQQWIKFTSQR